MCVEHGQAEGFADPPGGQGDWFTKCSVLLFMLKTDCQNKNAQDQVLSLHFEIMQQVKQSPS